MPTEEYLEMRERLREIFPRGRFVEDEDGTCILRARNRDYAKDHIFEQSPRKLLEIFYVGRTAARYLGPLAGYVVRHQAGTGEGILHVRWCLEVAERLPRFNLRAVTNPNGASPDTLARGRATQALSNGVHSGESVSGSRLEAICDAKGVQGPSDAPDAP